jgi:hypothetical protein
MADNGKMEDANGSDGYGGQETSATHHQSPVPNSPGQKASIITNKRSNSTDCKFLSIKLSLIID